jgi:serine/threonine-protein kinase
MLTIPGVATGAGACGITAAALGAAVKVDGALAEGGCGVAQAAAAIMNVVGSMGRCMACKSADDTSIALDFVATRGSPSRLRGVDRSELTTTSFGGAYCVASQPLNGHVSVRHVEASLGCSGSLHDLDEQAILPKGTCVGGRFVVGDVLGIGGMGIVYAARDELLGSEVALKLLTPRARQKPDACQRLRREAEIMQSLDAPQIAWVFDYSEGADGEAYIAMEIVRGQTVRALMAKGRIAPVLAIRIVREVANALSTAHRAGVIHRDVKPGNVMACGDDMARVVLLDFGVAKSLEDDADERVISPSGKRVLIGTPAYVAPEQAQGGVATAQSDQFSLAVMAFELLTGTRPWRGTSLTTVLSQVVAAPAPDASELAPELPRAVGSVLRRALAKDPANRYPNVETFAHALEVALLEDASACVDAHLGHNDAAPCGESSAKAFLRATLAVASLSLGCGGLLGDGHCAMHANGADATSVLQTSSATIVSDSASMGASDSTAQDTTVDATPIGAGGWIH